MESRALLFTLELLDREIGGLSRVKGSPCWRLKWNISGPSYIGFRSSFYTVLCPFLGFIDVRFWKCISIFLLHFPLLFEGHPFVFFLCAWVMPPFWLLFTQ